MSTALRPEVVEQRLDIIDQPAPVLETAPIFLARAAIQNQIAWEKIPEDITPVIAEERFTLLDGLYDYAMEHPKPFFSSLKPAPARKRLSQKWDFLQRIRAGQTREQIIHEIYGTEVDPRTTIGYAKMVTGVQNVIGNMLDTCRVEQANGAAGSIRLPDVTGRGTLRKILSEDPNCGEPYISMVEARWLGWSDEQLELGFVRSRRKFLPIFHNYVPILKRELGADSFIVQGAANQRKKSSRTTFALEERAEAKKPVFISEEEQQESQERVVFLQQYSKELLRPEQEVELGIKIQAGRRAKGYLQQMTDEGKRSLEVEGVTYTIMGVRQTIREGEESFFKFLTANRGLAFWAITKWRNIFKTLNIKLTRDLVEDIASDIILDKRRGLWRAIEKFDPTQGYKFSTYAADWLRIGVYEAAGARLPIPIDGHKVNNVFYKRAQHKRLERKLEAGELVDEEPLHMHAYEKVIEDLIFNTGFRSTDEYAYGNSEGDTSQTLGELLTYPGQTHQGEDNAIVAAETRITMEFILEKALSEEEIQVITMTLFTSDPMRRKKCAEALGCSESRISHLRRSALNKLQPHLEDIKDLF